VNLLEEIRKSDAKDNDKSSRGNEVSRSKDIKRQRVERREWPNAMRWEGICATR